MNILLCNAGSSSLKCSLMDSTTGRIVSQALVDWAGLVTRYSLVGSEGQSRTQEVAWRGHAESLRRYLGDLESTAGMIAPEGPAVAAVGHRVVHGGPFSSSVLVTPEVRSRIAALTDLAPLHNPRSLETLAAAEAEMPEVPQVAVFDTAFHATLPANARTYGVPESWTRDWGVRRFGFHGLSHAYSARRAAEMLGRPLGQLRLVICHLGHGCSASAVSGGVSVDTTMGFTPLEGLMMATRSGSIDPSIILHVQRHHGLTIEQIETILNHQSGLLGVSGISADMREVLAAAKSGHAAADLAIGIYVHRLQQAIGGLAVPMGGIDALVFTAGVGENAAEIRAQACARLECLGLELDAEANARCRPDADIARSSSPGRILVIAAREDLTMLREVVAVLEHSPSRSRRNAAERNVVSQP